MKIYKERIKITTLVVLIVNTFPAYALTVATGRGNSGGSDCTITCMKDYQQEYDHTLFGAGQWDISSITLYQHTQGIGTYDLQYSYHNPVTTEVFNSNIAPWTTVASFDLRTFINGANTISTTKLLYDTAKGDLLLRFVLTDTSSYAGGGFYAWNDINHSQGFQWRNSLGAGIYNGNVDNMYGLNTSFVYQASRSTASVPEPATLALMSLGFAGVSQLRRRKLQA